FAGLSSSRGASDSSRDPYMSTCVRPERPRGCRPPAMAGAFLLRMVNCHHHRQPEMRPRPLLRPRTVLPLRLSPQSVLRLLSFTIRALTLALAHPMIAIENCAAARAFLSGTTEWDPTLDVMAI